MPNPSPVTAAGAILMGRLQMPQRLNRGPKENPQKTTTLAARLCSFAAPLVDLVHSFPSPPPPPLSGLRAGHRYLRREHIGVSVFMSTLSWFTVP
jgi:hypothetical protein